MVPATHPTIDLSGFACLTSIYICCSAICRPSIQYRSKPSPLGLFHRPAGTQLPSEMDLSAQTLVVSTEKGPRQVGGKGIYRITTLGLDSHPEDARRVEEKPLKDTNDL